MERYDWRLNASVTLIYRHLHLFCHCYQYLKPHESQNSAEARCMPSSITPSIIDPFDISWPDHKLHINTSLDNLAIQDPLVDSVTCGVKCGLLPNSKQVSFNHSPTNRSWTITTPSQDFLLSNLSEF